MNPTHSLLKTATTVAIGLLAPAIVFAQALTLGIPEGSYKGKFRAQDKGRVHMMTQKIKGSQASFMAFIFKRQTGLFQSGEVQVQAYKALPTQDALVGNTRTATQYTLTPIAADEDGELTTPNDNPSLVLNVTNRIGTNDVEFTVVSAQSDNRTSFQSTMIFKGNESPFDVDDGESGELKRAGHFREEGTISVISDNPEDGSRAANVTWNGSKTESGGTYYLKEKAPGVFTFTGITFLATGTQPQPAPKKIVLFVKKSGSERALLVDPANSADVRELRIK